MGEPPTKNSTPKEVPARSEKGLEIIKHAFSEGGKVLEFKNGEKGMRVLDVTDHHRELQELADQE